MHAYIHYVYECFHVADSGCFCWLCCSNVVVFVWWQNCNLTWMCSCIIVKLVAAVDLFPPHWEAALANFQMKDYLVSFGLWFSEVWKWQINVPWKLPFVVGQFWFVIQWSLKVANKHPLKTAVCCGLVRRLRVPDSGSSSSHPGVLFPLKCLPLPPPPPPTRRGKSVQDSLPLSIPPPPPTPSHSMPHGHSISLTQSHHLFHSHPICPISLTVTPSVPQSPHLSHSHAIRPSHPISLSHSICPTVTPYLPQSPHLSISPSHPISISVTTISLSHPISPTVTPPLPKSSNLFHSHPISPTQTFHISPNHPSDSLTPSVSLTVTSYLPQPVHLSYSHSITQSLHLSRHPISHCHPISLSHSHSLSPTASPSVLQSLISTPPLSHSQLLSLSSLSTNSSLQSDTTLFRFVHYLLHTVCT